MTHAAVNSGFSVASAFVCTFAAQARTGDVAQIRDPQFPIGRMEGQIAEAVGPGHADFVVGTRPAAALLGGSIATNLFMVGYAHQKGFLPASGASILRTIKMNGAAVEMNKGAFLWGRRAALDLADVERVATPPGAVPKHRRLSTDLDEVISRRVAELTGYQNVRHSQRYADPVQRVWDTEAARAPDCTGLAEAVSHGHCKLLATKDEYEVARLYTETGFLDRVRQSFEGDFRPVFHLAPSLWTKPNPMAGEPRKRAFGPRTLRAFGVLAWLRRLRGTALDPFRFAEDRELDRRLPADDERLVEEVLGSLIPANHAIAVEPASQPDAIRGCGHVRKWHAEHAKCRGTKLIEKFRDGREVPDRGRERAPGAPVVMAG